MAQIESKEYRALEILSNLLYEELEPYRPTHARNWSREIIDKLLQQTYPCEKCENGQILITTVLSHGYKKCPDCEGTGKGGKVLAVRAKDQTITETLRTELDAYTERLLAHPMNMPQHMEIAIASIVGALKSFVKVVEE